MKRAVALSAALAMTSLLAGAMDSRALRLIGPDTKVVSRVDVERYRRSALSRLYPLDLSALAARTGISEIRELVTIVDGTPAGAPLFVVTGAANGEQPAASDDEDFGFVRLDASTVIAGNRAQVQEAVARWNQEVRRASDVAERARGMSGSFDLWFLAIRPLSGSHSDSQNVLKYRNELIQVIEEVRGGIRLGVSHEMRLEVLARTADDAVTLSALGRWVPGMIQLRSDHSPIRLLLSLMENLCVSAEGRTAVASFSIADSAFEEVIGKPRPIVE
jgi:hypothetical protein